MQAESISRGEKYYDDHPPSGDALYLVDLYRAPLSSLSPNLGPKHSKETLSNDK
jgi:hypothetical protein